MSTSAYRPLTEVEQLFKDLVLMPGVKLGEAYLEALVPVLAAPVVKQLEEEAVELIVNELFNRLVLLIDIGAIRLVNTHLQAAFELESLKLKLVAIEKGVDSDAYIQAREAAKLALSKFTQFGGHG